VTIAHFATGEPDPQRRGALIGAHWRDGIARTWEGYERLFAATGADERLQRELGEKALERTAAWAPALAAEIAGLAAGAGLEAWMAGALNARTEVLAAVGARTPAECSTFVVAPPAGGGPPRTIQTWDWYDHLRGNVATLELTPRPGRTVRVFTEFGVVGKIGLNSAGLGLHFNILRHADDGGAPGVPVHVVARHILDEADTVEAATDLARSAPVSASTVLTVAAWDGERASARCLELSPAGVAEVDPDADGVLRHTNHFLDSRLAEGERLTSDDPSTLERLSLLEQRTADLRVAGDPTARATPLLDHASGLCCHPEPGAPFDERWETLATLSLDLEATRLHVHEGGPCGVGADGWHVV
jgi:isopenicillin-N N-acyltransferase-like protein